MTDAVVAAREVGMVYGRGAGATRALDAVSLEVRAGEIVLVMGPSGSGKTTLLQVLGALIRPTSGSVSVEGRSIEQLSHQALSRLRLDFFGFVFQAHHLIPTLTAWENIALVLDLKGHRGRRAEARSRELIDRVGLTSRADAYPAEMSGGQRQRVAVARACATGPAVILADEPTASLDSASGAQIVQLLRDLAEQDNRAVVIVTHDGRLQSVADRVVTLEDGRIVASTNANLH